MKETIRKIVADRFQEKSFYVCDVERARSLVDDWTRLFPNITPYYAVKCNNDEVLLKTLAKKGVNFDCASRNEILQVLKLGVDPSRILFAHTIKSPGSLVFAHDSGTNLMTFDSTHELDKIKLYHPQAKTMIRIRSTDPMAIVKLNKYGANETEIEPLLAHAKTIGVTVVGISFHVGSGSRNPDAYWQALKLARETYDVAKDAGHDIRIVDIGGGMFADIEDDGTVTSCVAQYIQDGMRDFFAGIDVKFIAEPGRFFAQHYSVLACQVVGKRVREGLYEYFLNEGTYGGMSNCIHEKAEPVPVIVKDVDDDAPKHMSVLYGPTCDGVDVINKQVILPELHVDDWVYFESWGAYTNVIVSQFNGFGQYSVFYI